MTGKASVNLQTVPYYGKREPGLLTAASPGDTLHFQFGTYDDSGASVGIAGSFLVTDIEVFKDGLATARATDSGYSLISDTGQVGDRLGLHRFKIQLFNTADDAAFYASGSWYQVAVDALTLDSRTVRFWVGSFEIGRPRVNVYEIVGDTGAAVHLKQNMADGFADTGVNDRLAKILADTDTGIQSGVSVTRLFGDTGAANRLQQFADRLSGSGALDTGSVTFSTAGAVDANVTYVNEIRVTGVGTSGNEWRPE